MRVILLKACNFMPSLTRLHLIRSILRHIANIVMRIFRNRFFAVNISPKVGPYEMDTICGRNGHISQIMGNKVCNVHF